MSAALPLALMAGLIQGPAWPPCSVATHPSQTSADALLLANRFAPILEFAPGEQFFPTLPFFTAFDGRDNDGTSQADFADLGEIAPGLDREGRVSITRLAEAYRPAEPHRWEDTDHEGRQEAGLQRAVVHFRICQLTAKQSRTIRRYLLSDEQAYTRFDQDYPIERLIGHETTFDVIQYYLYYLRDAGLQGHWHDIELISVFLPRTDEDPAHDQIRIVVGSGHSPRTPNNVLLLSAPHRGVRRLDDDQFVLVELGGHSSAPDMPPYGRYTPGVDVNWHIYDVWGTRDVQAVGGIGYLGRYRPEMTFGREADAVAIFPPRFSPSERSCLDEALHHQAEQKIDTCLLDSTATMQPRATHQYRLVPVSLAVDLDQALARADSAVAASSAKGVDTTLADGVLGEVRTAVTALQRILCDRRGSAGPCRNAEDSMWNATRFADLTLEQQRNAATAMRSWRRATYATLCRPDEEDHLSGTACRRHAVVVGRDGPSLATVVQQSRPETIDEHPAGKHRIWDHASFKGRKSTDADPTIVFKPYLFRPSALGLSESGGLARLIVFGFKGVPDDGYGIYTGFVVPAWRSTAVPVRLGGVLEVHLGLIRSNLCCKGGWSPDFDLVLDGHRNAIVSWYGAGSWTSRRKDLVGDPNAGEFAIGGGLSLLPAIGNRHEFGLFNAFRIRIGARLDPFRSAPLDGVRWELQLGFRQ